MHKITLRFLRTDVEHLYLKSLLREKNFARLSFVMVICVSLFVVGVAVILSWFFKTNGPNKPIIFAVFTCEIPWLVCIGLSLIPAFTKSPAYFQSVQLVGCLVFTISAVVLYWTGVHRYTVPLGLFMSFLYTNLVAKAVFYYATLANTATFAFYSAMSAYVYRDRAWESLYYGLLYYSVCVCISYVLEVRARLQFALEVYLHQQRDELNQEKERTKNLILSVVPENVLRRVSSLQRSISDFIDEGSCCVFDIVGFTSICSVSSPQPVLIMLATLFSLIDAVVDRNGCERLKTLGDAYVVVSNVSYHNENHSEAVLRTALDVLMVVDYVNTCISKYPAVKWPVAEVHVRVGCHTGPMLAGVILMKNLIYDVYGPTLKRAEKLQESGSTHAAHCTQCMLSQVSPDFCDEFLVQPAYEFCRDRASTDSGFTSEPVDHDCTPADTPQSDTEGDCGGDTNQTLFVSRRAGPLAVASIELLAIADCILEQLNARFLGSE
eukprot:TRINITY_DN4590_c0_g1_i2.p1 TRINITY_DN4590_c0_g1~~TRINITY_DN4590_c0_g1_i2.p1  ORF type:complete len:493 (-),score=82.89 TRINITY_DN4590_c0_g1_i2:129-1607(-)